MRTVRTAALTGLLTLVGVAATADRADAQVYYSYYPGTTYYYNTTPFGGYQTYYNPGTSYYYGTPATNWNWNTAGYNYGNYYANPYTSYYTPPYTGYSNVPFTTWSGDNWGNNWDGFGGNPYNYSGFNNNFYNNPVIDAVNTYRAVRGLFRR